MKLLIFIMTLLAYTASNTLDCYAMGWLPPEDPPPIVTPPPTPPPVVPPSVPKVTTEYGIQSSYSTEINWHFSKRIAEYDTFYLFVGGKKYVISMSYKDNQVEVRDSETRKKMVVITPAAFKDRKVYIVYPSSETPTPPPVTPPPVKPADYSKDFAHENPCSWKNDGFPGCNGMTLITCPNIPAYTSVVFMADDGRVIEMHRHGDDRGRQQWTNYYWRKKEASRVAGYFLAKRGNQSWKFKMEKPNGTYADNTGKCYRQYR